MNRKQKAEAKREVLRKEILDFLQQSVLEAGPAGDMGQCVRDTVEHFIRNAPPQEHAFVQEILTSTIKPVIDGARKMQEEALDADAREK